MVSQIRLTGGEGQFGQNAQKLQENYKIVVFRSRQRGTCGGLTNFLGSGEDPTQSPSNLPWFKQISKGQFYQFNCDQKSVFNLLNPPRNSCLNYEIISDSFLDNFE